MHGLSKEFIYSLVFLCLFIKKMRRGVIYKMNLELKTYKNYKEICAAMEWEVKSGGKSKQLQLKDLERYCTYEKRGQKFIITEIFETPIPKEDKRNKYGNYLEKLLIHEISKRPLNKDGRTITVARNTLYFQLHMINQNYNYCRNHINKFSRYLEIPITTFYDFYNNTSSKLKDNVERALNKLQGRCLIKWEYRYAVKLRTGASRLATSDEVNDLLEAERKALTSLYEESKKDIFLKGKWNKFQQEVSNNLADTNIEYGFKVFYINTTKDFREMLLEENDLEEYQNELNATMYFSAIETATNKHNNMQEKWRIHSLKKGIYFGRPKYDSERVQLRPQYIDDTKKIASKVIDYDIYKIDLTEISSEKYTLMEALIDESNGDWGEKIPFLDDALEQLFG